MGTGLNSGMGAGLGPETAGARPIADERIGLDRDDDFVRDTTTSDRPVSGKQTGPANPPTV
jgi:hypothetical protein